MRQNGFAGEILIVDDGSDAEALNVAKALVAQDARVKLITQSNQGVSAARNLGASRAQHDWLTFLDADDRIVDRYFELVHKVIAEYRTVNLISCDVELFGEEQKIWKPEPYETYTQRYHNSIASMVTISSRAFKDIGGYRVDFPWNEDWDFFIRGEKAPLHVAHLSEPLYQYRVTKEGLAKSYMHENWPLCAAMVMTANPELYPATRVLTSHSVLGGISPRWQEGLERQYQKHPSAMRLGFWLALSSLAKGDVTTAQQAFLTFASEFGDWQSYYQLIEIFKKRNLTVEARTCAHEVRKRRPDLDEIMNHIVIGLK